MEEQREMKKHFPKWIAAAGAAVCLLLAIYGGGVYYYQSHFLPGTVVDRLDVSGMTLEELEAQVQDYRLRVLERQTDGSPLEEIIQGRDISLTYSSMDELKGFLESQRSWLWFISHTAKYQSSQSLSYDEDELKTAVRGLSGMQKEAAAPTDAYIEEAADGTGYRIVPETEGNKLNFTRTFAAIQEAAGMLADTVDLSEAGCYEEPETTAEDEALNRTLANLKKYEDIRITYTFGNVKEILDGDTIGRWITADENGVTVDREKVEEYVASLRKQYDTVFRARTFKTSYGSEITINRGDYGWWMDTEQETQELLEMIERGESGERTPVYRQTAAQYATPDYGTTYVEINLTAQHLFLYVNGERILESDFVSGNPSRGNATPDGIYGITYKQRNATLNGENYSTPVSYWMPFNGNVGMHDANWRGTFGGDIYKTNGSHGCINLPPSVAKEIYGYVEKDTPVICYHLPGTEPVPAEPEPTEPVPAESVPTETTEPAAAAETPPEAAVPAE